ncbi:MAG TPA: tetratricopeptide repeat protein [Pyrinomonadaceae bacterium]|nr:tetratricopeptide repeat protein [Pyrinomonadaceae bacterium]
MPPSLSYSVRSVKTKLIATLFAGIFLFALTEAHAQEPGRQLMQTGSAGDATKRIALVMGNSTYATAPALKNPANDARDMAAALKALGFEVSSGVNLSQREMKRLIREFGQRLKGGGHGLFYFAGHGVQARGHNYMIPVDADIQSEADVEDSGVDVNLVLSYMDDAQNHLNIVILDACRNNPFARSFRSASDGLAQVDAPTGTLIAYATAPGRVAADGAGENGLYTSELLKAMRSPGLTATEMFMQVRREVMNRTGNKQVPWEASSLTGSFYFTPRGANSAEVAEVGRPVNTEAAAPRTADAATFELSYWETIKGSSEPQDFISYLEKYPKGQFVELARRRASASALAAAAETHNQKGVEFYTGKNYAAAETEFRTALFFSPNSVYHTNLANTLRNAGKPGEAEERREAVRHKEVELKEAVRQNPNSESPHYYLAAFYKEHGRLSEAENTFREAVRVGNYYPYSTSSTELVSIYTNQNRHAEAEALLREIVRVNTAKGGSGARQAHSQLGRFFVSQNRLTEAEAAYRTALSHDPDDFSTLSDLARVLAKQNRVKDSDNEWKAYIKRKPEYAHFFFGLHLTEQKRWADAEVQYREALKLAPDDLDKLNYLVQTLEEQRKTAEAEAELKRFAARKPGAAAYFSLGGFYSKNKRWAEAEAAFRESMRIEPAPWNVSNNLGELLKALKEQKKHGEAETELRALIRRETTATNYQKLGSFFESLDKWPEAEIAYREAVRLEPTTGNQSKVVETLLAQQKFQEAEDDWKAFLKNKPEEFGYWMLGNLLSYQRKFAEAELVYAEATKLAPTVGRNFSYLGTTLRNQQKFDEAEAAFRIARKLEPNDGGHAFNIAQVLVKKGKLPEAEAEMKAFLQQIPKGNSYSLAAVFFDSQKRFAEAEAMEREAIRRESNPSSSYVHYLNLGKYLEKQNKHAEAEAAFREAIRIQSYQYAYNAFGDYLKRQGRWAEAEAQYRLGLATPYSSPIPFELAVVLAKQNKLVEAEAEYKQAEALIRKIIRIYPFFSYERHRLGATLEGQNRLAEAAKEYAEALRLDPDTTEYKESLDRVRANTKTP